MEPMGNSLKSERKPENQNHSAWTQHSQKNHLQKTLNPKQKTLTKSDEDRLVRASSNNTPEKNKKTLIDLPIYVYHCVSLFVTSSDVIN